MRLRSILFAVAVALAVLGTVAVAQQVRDGSTSPTNGLSYWPMGGSDGTSNRVVKLDPNGILRVTEEYPGEYQTQAQNVHSDSSIQVHHALRAFNTSWTDYPFARRCLEVGIKEPTATPQVMYLLLYGSNDNVNFYPVVAKSRRWGLNSRVATMSSAGAVAYFGAATVSGDSVTTSVPYVGAARADTADAGYVGWLLTPQMRTAGATTTILINVPDDVYVGRYGALYARTDSTTNAHARITSVTFYGRMR